VESAHAIKGNELVALSEQQLVECTGGQSKGCNGGETYDAYSYLMNHNAYLAEDWPYTATNSTDGCTYEAAEASDITLSSYVCVESQSPEAMKAAVAKGPIAVSVAAGCHEYYFYKSGVLDTSCSTRTNHAIQIVGYGHDEASGLDYWLTSNSWTTVWGDKGYAKIAITQGEGILGINLKPSYPILA